MGERSVAPSLVGRVATLLLVALLALPLASQSAVPTPAEFLGFEPGTDRKLADYDQVYAYFMKLAATTDRVRFSSIGKTTENHELGFAIISAPKNLANLEEIRKTNLALVDPRKGRGEAPELISPAESAALVAKGKTIVCLNASIHSTEVGPTQATLSLAHFLATTQDPEWLKVLDDVVLLMLPCHNPDGYLKIVDWYRKWVGTPHEACAYPGLYHTYAGHDNNRDWFMFNLQETRLTVKEVYLKWVPQIVMDMHQMGEDGARLFIPPYQDPIEPNVDPILIDRLNELGLSVQKELFTKGLKGIVNNSIFDAWSPSRAYMHYHGGVRFLVEVASCRQATPIERKGFARRAESRTATNPEPWYGDRWGLADIVRYDNETALAVLRHASNNRKLWLSSFHEVFRKACGSRRALAISNIRGCDEWKLGKLIDVLELGGVEAFVREELIPGLFMDTLEETLVIPRAQPYFAFAAALLKNTSYPEIRTTESQPIRQPYDVTSHCLPFFLGIPEPELASGRFKPDRDVKLQDFRALKPLSDGIEPMVFFGGGHLPLHFYNPDLIGVYTSSLPNVTDEGWTRFTLERLGAGFRCLGDDDCRRLGEVHPGKQRLRVLVLPSMTTDQILRGNQSQDFPPDYRGGMGDEGAAAIERFVREGGTLVALRDAAALPIRLFRMPLRNAMLHVPEGRRVDIPGAMLALDVDSGHRIGESPRNKPGTKYRVPALFDGGKAFEPDDAPDRDTSLKPEIVARWAPVTSIHLSGHAEGLDLIAGRAALISCRIGNGRVILFGFSPQFRGQTWGTFPLFANAILSGIERQ